MGDSTPVSTCPNSERSGKPGDGQMPPEVLATISLTDFKVISTPQDSLRDRQNLVRGPLIDRTQFRLSLAR